MKCNIGVAWKKADKSLGGAWVLRDQKGVVLMYSRTSFVNIESHPETNIVVWSWEFEAWRLCIFIELFSP